jgi:hypothetical protein
MKPYDDEGCPCYKIEAEIDEISEDWNLGKACDLWSERKHELEDNDIEFEPYSDSWYSCTCPTCGRSICGWCV